MTLQIQIKQFLSKVFLRGIYVKSRNVDNQPPTSDWVKDAQFNQIVLSPLMSALYSSYNLSFNIETLFNTVKPLCGVIQSSRALKLSSHMFDRFSLLSLSICLYIHRHSVASAKAERRVV